MKLKVGDIVLTINSMEYDESDIHSYYGWVGRITHKYQKTDVYSVEQLGSSEERTIIGYKSKELKKLSKEEAMLEML